MDMINNGHQTAYFIAKEIRRVKVERERGGLQMSDEELVHHVREYADSVIKERPASQGMFALLTDDRIKQMYQYFEVD